MLTADEKRRRLEAHLDQRDRREKVARANAAARRGQTFVVPTELQLREYVAPSNQVQPVAKLSRREFGRLIDRMAGLGGR